MLRILVNIFFAVHCTALCTDRFVPKEDVSREGDDRLEHERQIIVPHLQFMCSGRITRLIVSTDDETGRNGGPNPIVFQIWRPISNTTYRLIRMIELPQGVAVGSDDYLLVNFSIPTGTNLFFHDGDVVGYYQPDDLRARIWTVRNSSYPAYRLRVDNYTTTFDINGESVQRRDDRQPLIHMIYESVCLKPSLQYGSANCSSSDDNDILVAVGGSCNIQCDAGYRLQSANGTIFCLPNGLWSLQEDCTTVGSSKSSANGGVIAGGVIAAILLLLSLLAVVILLIWLYRKRFKHCNIPPINCSVSNGAVIDKDFKADNFYYSIDKNDTLFKQHRGLSTTIYDNPDFNHSHVAQKNSNKTAPELPPERQPVNSRKPGEYEYPSIANGQVTTVYDYSEPVGSALPNRSGEYEYPSTPDDKLVSINYYSEPVNAMPTNNKPGDYECPSFTDSQTISVDYSKNVARWHKMSVQTDEQSPRYNTYVTAAVNEEAIYEDPGTSKEKIYAYFEQKKFRKISAKDLRIDYKIGSGQFGIVHKGQWISNHMIVAIKSFNSVSSESDRVKFLREAAIMGQFLHNNVVQLHGVVTEEENMMIVLEYMPKGDLRNYLSEIRTKTSLSNDKLPEILLTFCKQIAAGMNYLANKQFIHRDLAARNILVSSDDVCKIADFGMARDVTDDNLYVASGGKVPVKWTAPEALLYQRYSVFSDVWSYGCVLYEVWSIGHIPFEDVTGITALQKVSRGYRLPPPPGCPKGIYQLMIHCWHSDPKRRPSFDRILMDLRSDKTNVLEWSAADLRVVPRDATILGGSLSAGKDLFVMLQNAYKS